MSINTVTTAIAGNLGAGFPDGLLLLGTPQTLAATGSAYTDAAAITGNCVITTGGDGSKGIQLPVPTAPMQWCLVYNSASGDVKVYPNTGGTINGGSTNAAALQEDLSLGLYVSTTALNWAAIYTAG
jgi:hypothetical protein